MHITWGMLEAVINFLNIVRSVDLRFYRPVTLPADIRAIVISENYPYISEAEEEFDDENFYCFCLVCRSSLLSMYQTSCHAQETTSSKRTKRFKRQHLRHSLLAFSRHAFV